jgi:3-deoxy-D-manno-octulosonate 8-phosphate phosphatase (KDO 8-P phosphatase)
MKIEMNYKANLHQIKAFVFDVDGVFTDGGVLAIPGGEFLRMHNAKDGFAVRNALVNGYAVGIITGGASETIRDRFAMLGVDPADVHLGIRNKREVFAAFCDKYLIAPSEVLAMGDDIPDIPMLAMSGVATCPADAAPEVMAVCHYISGKAGGCGCARDVIEQTLKLHGKWYNATETPSN